ncbi:MAG TPA: hypothetical protein VM684_07885 [Gaiellales bacterium]|nr:hypothetical protein [Gaiellales bacterium]
MLAIVAAALWLPWATKERVVVAATPVPPPLFGITPAPLKGGSTACMQQVTFSPETQIGEIGVATGGKPGPPLTITASAHGYHASARIGAGYQDDPAVRFPLLAPGGAVIGQLCIRNEGRSQISLNSTTEFRTQGRPSLLIDGTAQPMDPHLAFYSRVQQSYFSRAAEILGHAAVFTPPFLPKALLMFLALVALVGIPAAMILAFARAARDD